MAPQATLPVGSLILVTGVSGYISAQVVQQLLDRGYKVRGTVRDPVKSEWISNDLFAKQAASGNFELVSLKDVKDQSQVKAAIKGVAGVIHIATPNTLDPNPNNVIPETVDLVVELAKAAATEKSIKEFVYTSTIGAISPLPFKPGFHFDGTQWNDDIHDIAWAPPPYTPERGFPVYVQSKVEAEKAFWKFVNEERPNFNSNTIIVSTVFGPRLHVKQGGSTAEWLIGVANNDATAMQFFPTCEHSYWPFELFYLFPLPLLTLLII
jgi:nucleoside-diphosphate-sugar epimerase